ncbi:MAG: hypothetical protein CL536_00930 [Alcaligenaceae bacterium]|nr:hypothetical protein [Alcaligenaceae bacterium]
MNKSLEEIMNASAAAGPFGTGDAVLEQTLRDFIQLQSTRIAVGTQVVGTRTVPWLEFKWYTGVSGTFSYPLDDAATVDPTKIGTSNYTVKLQKGQGRCVFLDTVRLRGESFENIDRQQLAIIRGRADVIDNNILSTLHGGAGQSQAATATFGSASADEEKDLLATMDKIFENGRVSGDEPMALILPASTRSALLNTQLYGNVVESLADHMRRIANMTIYYTRDYTGGKSLLPTDSTGAIEDDALLLIPGAETAEFYTYNGAGYQETELTRLPGVGFDWLLTGYMGSVVHEHQDGAAAGKSNRIAKITGVI